MGAVLGWGGARACRVLIVHADAGERRRLGAILKEGFRCELEEAASAGEALAMLGRREYRLVLCDARVSEERGLDVFRFVRQRYPRRTFFLLFTDGGVVPRGAGTDQLVAVDSPSPGELRDAVRFLGVPAR